MSVLSDKWIRKMSKKHNMISPFVSKQVRKGKISFGLSSYGYDARVSNDFKKFTNVNSTTVDPKKFKKEGFVHKKRQSFFSKDLFSWTAMRKFLESWTAAGQVWILTF